MSAEGAILGVMAGLDPAIHVSVTAQHDVEARVIGEQRNAMRPPLMKKKPPDSWSGG
jgi:hypothetical protein